MSLTNEDREALTRALIRDSFQSGDRQTFAAVEQIVARHVAEAARKAWFEGHAAGWDEARCNYEHDDDAEGSTPNPYASPQSPATASSAIAPG